MQTAFRPLRLFRLSIWGWLPLFALNVNAEFNPFRDNPDEREERRIRDEEARARAAAIAAEKQATADEASGLIDSLRQAIDRRVYDELFDTELPGSQPKGQWTLRLNPKFGDFLDDDHVRFPIQLRYSFSNYFEAFVESGFYFPNPFGDGDRWDFYTIRVGGKYSWLKVPNDHFDISVGATADMPVRYPPPDVSDGYARYEPYFSISYRWIEKPATLLYLNLSYQFIAESPFKSTPQIPRSRDFAYVRPGIVYYPGGRFRYSFELEYRTNALDFRSNLPAPQINYGDDPNYIRAYEQVHELIAVPGVTWFPSKKIRDGLFIPGNWDLGIRLEIPIIDETDEGFGVSLRFRWFYDYRKFLTDDLMRLLDFTD